MTKRFDENRQAVKQEVNTLSDTANLIANAVTSATIAGAGIATGLNTGSTATAINVDSNNRQLHVDEAKVLKKLTEGKSKQEQDRLRAVACALVKCSEGVPESDVNYKGLKAFEALGETYIKEKNALKATGLFTYSNWDKANDIRTNHDEAVTRVGGAGKVITGDVGTQRDFYLGGMQQIVVPKPWTIKDVKVVESSSLK